MPVLFSGDALEAFPPFLRDKVHAYFVEPKNYVTALSQLILALAKYADRHDTLESHLKTLTDGMDYIKKLPSDQLEQRYQLEQTRLKEQQARIEMEVKQATQLNAGIVSSVLNINSTIDNNNTAAQTLSLTDARQQLAQWVERRQHSEGLVQQSQY